MNRLTRMVGSAAIVAAHGCASTERPPSSPVIRRDSAGIEIVENSLPTQELPEWRVAEAPTVSIGGPEAEGPASFAQVFGARRLRNGQIAVSDARAGEVRLFDSTGRYLRLLGRRGGGPGEFAYPGPPTRYLADSFVVTDQSRQRVAVYTPDGQFVRPVGYPRFDSDRPFMAQGLLPAEEFWGLRVVMDWPQTVGIKLRAPTPYVRFRNNGVAIDTIAVGRGAEYVTVPGKEGEHTFVTIDDLGMGASSEAQVTSNRLYLGDTDTPAVTVYALDGTPVRIIRWRADPEPVTEDDRRQAILFDSLQLAGSPGGAEGMRRQMFENIRTRTFANQAPFFTALLVADDGALWIEQFPRPWRLVRRYLVVDSTGTMVARSDLPPKFRPYHIGPDFVLGRWRDDDDVDHIRLYRLPGAPGR